MRSCLIIVLFLALLFLSCGGGTEKICLYNQAELRASSPDFSFDALNFFSGRKNRTDVYIQIPYAALQFTKEAADFVAAYTITINVLDTKDSLVAAKEWSERISVPQFEETTSRIFKLNLKSFYLPPGKYRVRIKVTDDHSQKWVRREKSIRVTDFARYKLSLSSIMLVSKVMEEKGVRTIVPNVSNEIGSLANQFSVFFEIYNFTGVSTLLLSSKMLGFNFNPSPFADPNQTRRSITDSLVVSRDSIIVANDTVIQCFLRFDRPQRSHCDLTLRISTANGSTRLTTRKDSTKENFVAAGGKSFVSRPLGFPSLLTIDQKIEPLVYIATEEEFRFLKSAKTTREKEERLRQFWEKHRDREEYYARVEYANKYFTCNAEGWRTPMGAVYILLGPPVSVQCFEPGTETWFYDYAEYRGLWFRFTVGEELEGGNPCYRSVAGLYPEQVPALKDIWRR